MSQKIKNRDSKLSKRRNMKDQNAFHKEKSKSRKMKKKYDREDM